MDYARQTMQYGRISDARQLPGYTSNSTESHPLNGIETLTTKQRRRRGVFILHFSNIGDTIGKAILRFAAKLRELCVDVAIDLFELDNPPRNWSAWYEQKLMQSDVVLCMIDDMFYNNLTSGSRVVGYTVYNLMNDPNVNVTFRAVFLDRPKDMMYVPPAMQGGTSYCISSSCLGVENEEFANLYANLTGQNRIQKPKLGQMIKLAPKTGRFGQQKASQQIGATSTNRIVPQQMQRPHDQFLRQPMNTSCIQDPKSHGRADLIFNLLGDDVTQICVLPSHQRMLMSLATNLLAEWEALGRMLNISEAELYAVKRDYMYSVQEQAVQVLRKWLDKNGSKATLGVLTTAVYSLGPPYWNLLDIISQYAP
ncbi:uncharacterized protein [Dysidea avara]|uniref:uncharacterized protein n=1 Tax=Dysidea avara TaxID=196820 RepID=UPI0033311863